MYIGTTINESPVIAGALGAEMKGDPAFLAVKFNTDGNLVLAGAGEPAIGIITPGCGENLPAGDEVTVQIKESGLARAGSAVSCGDALACGADGKLVKAAAGAFSLGYALSAALTSLPSACRQLKGGFMYVWRFNTCTGAEKYC